MATVLFSTFFAVQADGSGSKRNVEVAKHGGVSDGTKVTGVQQSHCNRTFQRTMTIDDVGARVDMDVRVGVGVRMCEGVIACACICRAGVKISFQPARVFLSEMVLMSTTSLPPSPLNLEAGMEHTSCITSTRILVGRGDITDHRAASCSRWRWHRCRARCCGSSRQMCIRLLACRVDHPISQAPPCLIKSFSLRGPLEYM